jgi:UDP-glucose 4-epimerase
VYGDQAVQPLVETCTPDPRTPYAVSKLAAEYYVRTIGALWGIETVCLRVFNAYGPGQHLPPSHPPVIPNMLRQAVGKGTVVVHGEGGQTRDFVYVEDVVRAMVGAATAPDVVREIINVGSGVETSIAELARVVLKVTESDAEIVHSPRTGPGVARLCADISRAKQLLGYQPRVKLEEGLKLTLAQDPRFMKV